MKKCELLSPAGNMEMLKYAVSYGADAVYLAGTRFGARKFAANFTDEELVQAIEYAHLYGVKVYVTINTLVYESEVEEFIEYVKYIHNVGVDAVLVQDFGMLKLIHEVVPNLELHASTQMHNNGKNILELLKRYGVKRVVLDREMSLEEIKTMPRDIEKEVFCHGALCVSYSGQCLFSSKVLGRSGNRGECAGLCRLSYKTKQDKEGKYYLSLKDLCTTEYIDKIIESGVDSLKIEGRMKSPEYVGYMTKVYRRLIDSYYEGTFSGASEEEMRNIKILFNRGFTRGFINGVSNEEMGNLKSPNHIGIHLGEYSIYKDKVRLKLDESLCQGDVIRFKEDSKGMTVNFLYDKNDKLVNKGEAGEVVFVDNFLDLENEGELRLVGSALLNKELAQLPKRKVKIEGEVYIEVGKKMRLTVFDGIREISVEGEVAFEAKTAPVDEESVRRQLCKTGNTVYEFERLSVILEGKAFVNLKDLNILRREALEKLDKRRCEDKKDVKFCEVPRGKVLKTSGPIEVKVVVQNEDQASVANKYTHEIYTSRENAKKFGVYPKYGENPSGFDGDKYMIGDLGSLVNVREGDSCSADYMLNVTNSYTVSELEKLGCSSVDVSLELEDSEVKRMVEHVNPYVLDVFVYGRCELMKMKYEPEIEGNEIIDRNGKVYPLKKEEDSLKLLSWDMVDKIENIRKYIEMGIRKFRVDFFDEDKEECEKILKTISEIISSYS